MASCRITLIEFCGALLLYAYGLWDAEYVFFVIDTYQAYCDQCASGHVHHLCTHGWARLCTSDLFCLCISGVTCFYLYAHMTFCQNFTYASHPEIFTSSYILHIPRIFSHLSHSLYPHIFTCVKTALPPSLLCSRVHLVTV